MIYIKDDFLDKDLYKELISYSDKFEKVVYPDKSFFVKELPAVFKDYIVNRKGSEKCLNGTAFWEHTDYGYTYSGSGEKEFNNLLKQDSNDLDKWKLNSVIGYKDNRLLSYPCDYFHSKYPNEYQKQRIVLIMFYKYE